MNKQLIAALFLILMVTGAAAQRQIYDADASVLTANAESVSPYPVEPGTDFTVQFRVYNDGGESARNVRVETEENSMFYLTGKGEDLETSFNLCAGCTRDATYYFTASPDARSGNYPLIFKVIEGDNYHEEKVFIRVVGQPDIIFAAQVLDEVVTPDSSFEVLLDIQNVGTGIARNLKLVPQTPGFVMSDSNIVFIDELNPGAQSEQRIIFMASDSLEPGPQTLSFSISYKDENSNTYASDQSLGVDMKSSVDVDIASVTMSPQLVFAYDKFDLAVRVENLGQGEAKNIKVKVDSPHLTGQKTAYIGMLEEDEDAPAYFALTTGFAGDYTMNILVEYEDDLGSHLVEESVSLKVMKAKSMILLVAVIVLASCSAALFIYSRKRKKKKA